MTALKCDCPKDEKHAAGCLVGQHLLLQSHGMCGNVDHDKLYHCGLPLNHKGKCHDAQACT